MVGSSRILRRSILDAFEMKGPAFSDIELLRKLALSKERNFLHNEVLMAKGQRLQFAAVTLTALQISFWIISLLSIGVFR